MQHKQTSMKPHELKIQHCAKIEGISLYGNVLLNRTSLFLINVCSFTTQNGKQK